MSRAAVPQTALWVANPSTVFCRGMARQSYQVPRKSSAPRRQSGRARLVASSQFQP